jgi:SsrA-binding protein
MTALAINKRATYDYDILETFEGGLALTGAEVKSAKAGSVQLKGAFLQARGNELWLKNAFVAKYAPAGDRAHDPYRDRKVLMHRRELNRLMGRARMEGLTIVPIRVYTRGSLVKLAFGLARGKKKYEKRETIKKREIERHLREKMKE